MPARISVLSGVSRGSEAWIENEVMRIGSAAECDFCLPDPKLSSHAMTLEFRDGKYYVYNKTPTTIMVANRPVPTGGSASWPPGTDVQLTRELFLRLLVEGDLRPSARPVARPIPGAAGGAGTSADSKGPSNTGQMVQVMVIGLCFLVVLAAVLFGGEAEDTADPGSGNRVGYASLLDELTMAKRENDAIRLQNARRLENQNENTKANAIYAEISNELTARRIDNNGQFKSDLDAKLWRYINSRLNR